MLTMPQWEPCLALSTKIALTVMTVRSAAALFGQLALEEPPLITAGGS